MTKSCWHRGILTVIQTIDLLLAATGGQILIPLSRACQLAGFKDKTWRNKSSAGAAPFPATSTAPLRVDVRDLAVFIDSCRNSQKIKPSAPNSDVLTEGERKRGRGRPRKSEGVQV